MDPTTKQSQELIQKPQNDIEYILSERIGMGPAQTRLSLPIYVLLFTEGCQSAVISVLLDQLVLEWDIDKFQKSLLITVIYIGIAIGNWAQSFADTYGRLTFVKWNAILQTIFGIASCFSPNYYVFLALRFIYGIGIGMVLPISGTYISEITPTEKRSYLVIKSRLYWGVGCLLTFGLAWWLLIEHHWRILTLIICLPGIYGIFQIYRTGKQSLRYLWARGRTQQAYQVIKYMCQLNNKSPPTKQQITEFIQLKKDNQTAEQQQVSYKSIFNKKYCFMTLCLMWAWFAGCFIYYGLLNLLPTILKKSGTSSYDWQYGALMIITVFQISVYFYVKKMLENKFFGRRRTLYITFLIITACSLVLILFNTVVDGDEQIWLLMIVFMFMRMAVATNVLAILPFTIEIYSTLIRSKALGLCSIIGRAATLTIGFVGINALEWVDGNGLYIILAGLSFFAFLSILAMPYDTLGRALDS